MRPRSSVLIAMVFLAGCAAFEPGPDEIYRRTLETALESRFCPPSKVAAVFSAYERWYEVAQSAPGYVFASEADVLLAQAEAFQTVGCDDAARASYESLLNRFLSDAYIEQRIRATRALEKLPPPYPLSGSPTRGT